MTENVGTSGLKFEIWFRKRSQDTWVLQANSAQVKNNWVRMLEKILWNQAIKNRECRLTELSSMGIGSKPNLDLKLSEDNILDRQINTNVNLKGKTVECNHAYLLCHCGDPVSITHRYVDMGRFHDSRLYRRLVSVYDCGQPAIYHYVHTSTV